MRVPRPDYIAAAASIVLLGTVWPVSGSSYQATSQSNPAPDEVIRRAAANEEKLKAAERDYSYRQDILIQTFGEAGSVTGQLHRLSEITYDDLGNRVDRIIEFPPSRLTTALGIARPDFKSLLGVDPFFLTTQNLSRYSIKFIERQKLDELNTYMFEVEPADAKRKRQSSSSNADDTRDWPFKGRIWIDDRDLQIVKAEGRAATGREEREKFPKFEYYREFVGDKLWLPSFVSADDVLEFRRFDLPIRMRIRYTGYKKVQRRR